MFKCPKCGNKLLNFLCKKCNYEIPIHNGVKYFCDDENINTKEDGYKKIVITMDNNPLIRLEKGYKMIHIFDFLLNENILKEI